MAFSSLIYIFISVFPHSVSYLFIPPPSAVLTMMNHYVINDESFSLFQFSYHMIERNPRNRGTSITHSNTRTGEEHTEEQV